ncbi:MAG: biotin/lipoyl-binding protein, partial [Acidobacteriota bacterium]
VHLFDGSRPVTLMSPLAIALKRQRGEASDAGGAIRAPMPGRVVKLLAQVGDSVEKGQGIMVVEAMKMQNELQAPFDGTVKEIRVEEGASVDRNVDLAMIE